MTKTKRGGFQLTQSGYTYQKRLQKGTKQYWRCKERSIKCNGSAVSNLDCSEFQEICEHNHVPDTTSGKILENYEILKQKIADDLRTPVPQIYREILSAIDDPIVRVRFPDFK